MRFLVVEDVPLMRRIIVNSLIDMGFRDVFEAEDGEEALGILQSHQIDIIITDILMPRMGGIDLVKSIRKVESLKKIPVIVITTLDTKESVKEVISAKVNYYITKPFKSEVLKEKIQKILDKIQDPEEVN
jgi:two-component system, chemotaxis family, chemotaxis protein CheY